MNARPIHVINVSADPMVARTREMVLKRHGYRVKTALDVDALEKACHEGGFDLAILGHSLNPAERERALSILRNHCGDAPVLDIDRKLLDPAELLATIQRITRRAGSAADED